MIIIVNNGLSRISDISTRVIDSKSKVITFLAILTSTTEQLTFLAHAYVEKSFLTIWRV